MNSKNGEFLYFVRFSTTTNMKKAAPPVNKPALSKEEEIKLFEVLNSFIDWLAKKGMVENMPEISGVEMPYSTDDWVMRFNTKNGEVSFNTFLRQKGSFGYYQSIIIHEFFHLAVQKVPNKDDATKVKDDFGGELMKLIDIEADFYTALFYKEMLGYNLVEYLTLYWEGSNVFKDRWIRIGKLERYIGTLLGITKMFINHPNKKDRVEAFDLYLVAISPLFSGDKAHVLIVTKDNIFFDWINASVDDFNSIKDCYTNDDEISLKAYVKKIIRFVTKALNLDTPELIQKQIENLK